MKRIGSYTIQYENNPLIAGFGSVVGKKESEGPLSQWFHKKEIDTKLGCDGRHGYRLCKCRNDEAVTGDSGHHGC